MLLSYFSKDNFKKHRGKISLWLILVLIGVLLLSPLANFSKDQADGEKPTNQAIEVQRMAETEVHLITHFLCGKDLVETKKELNMTIDEIRDKYSDWIIFDVNNNVVTMERFEDDLAPECKEGAFFGLSPDGVLTLYQGDPEENQVIETFFRIDIESLESGLPREPIEQLYKGIPVKNITEYHSILSTYSEFVVEEGNQLSNSP